jgi:regulator of replication initiation timing
MSVENKIKELLERVNVKASLEEAEMMGASGVSKDSSISPANSGDATNPKQGSSQDATYEVRDEKEANQGAQVSKGVKKNDIQMKAPVGDAPNFTTVADPASAVNQPNSDGNKPMKEEDETAEQEDAEVISEDETTEQEENRLEDESIDLSPIFGDDLSEEFRQKATSIFEAAVIARVNNEIEKITSALEEKYSAEIVEYKDSIVEKIDSYLNYVVENWMEENQLAIENGLRTEIAEDFITGLKVLFKEHYIEVPEEKYDVIGELQSKVEDLEENLDVQLENNVNLNAEVSELKKQLIIKEMTDDLADTEVNKLNKLLEGVEFENDEIYREKVKVIKENYFPADAHKESVTSQQALIEETDQQAVFSGNDVISSYAQALSRTIKRN